MKINIHNKNEFVDNFLSPIGKINENAVIKITDTKLSSLISTNDETLILFVTCDQPANESVNCNLNIPDISRLIKVFNCVDNTAIDIHFDKNKLKYTSDNINFKYHLLEDGIISTPSISFDKVKKLNFRTVFKVKSSDMSSLIKASTFTVDTDKLYVYTRDGKVYCELTDKQKHNIDSFSSILSDGFDGDDITTSIPVNFEVFRLMSSLRFDTCDISIDPERKVLLCVIQSGDFTLNFITVGLVG